MESASRPLRTCRNLQAFALGSPLGEVKHKLWFDERVEKLRMERFIEVP